ncbi:hypothetical protein QLH52_11595 [Methylomonas sp. OY6]|uniref:Uncharacterized protein n=1 Tax=Methylomonas defluvii TaxID=3045149 RepID=A0ABU4UEQ7_9GAMM|nr:hypothetical protein [Methylomonas sp. OY6]MDX8127927.1 hypothetical protein [Methylomonas sp. OY6]
MLDSNHIKHDIRDEILEDFTKDFIKVMSEDYGVDKNYSLRAASVIVNMLKNIDKIQVPCIDILDYMAVLHGKDLDVFEHIDIKEFFYWLNGVIANWFCKTTKQEMFCYLYENLIYIMDPTQEAEYHPASNINDWWDSLRYCNSFGESPFFLALIKDF